MATGYKPQIISLPVMSGGEEIEDDFWQHLLQLVDVTDLKRNLPAFYIFRPQGRPADEFKENVESHIRKRSGPVVLIFAFNGPHKPTQNIVSSDISDRIDGIFSLSVTPTGFVSSWSDVSARNQATFDSIAALLVKQCGVKRKTTSSIGVNLKDAKERDTKGTIERKVGEDRQIDVQKSASREELPRTLPQGNKFLDWLDYEIQHKKHKDKIHLLQQDLQLTDEATEEILKGILKLIDDRPKHPKHCQEVTFDKTDLRADLDEIVLVNFKDPNQVRSLLHAYLDQAELKTIQLQVKSSFVEWLAISYVGMSKEPTTTQIIVEDHFELVPGDLLHILFRTGNEISQDFRGITNTEKQRVLTQKEIPRETLSKPEIQSCIEQLDDDVLTKIATEFKSSATRVREILEAVCYPETVPKKIIDPVRAAVFAVFQKWAEQTATQLDQDRRNCVTVGKSRIPREDIKHLLQVITAQISCQEQSPAGFPYPNRRPIEKVLKELVNTMDQGFMDIITHRCSMKRAKVEEILRHLLGEYDFQFNPNEDDDINDHETESEPLIKHSRKASHSTSSKIAPVQTETTSTSKNEQRATLDQPFNRPTELFETFLRGLQLDSKTEADLAKEFPMDIVEFKEKLIKIVQLQEFGMKIFKKDTPVRFLVFLLKNLEENQGIVPVIEKEFQCSVPEMESKLNTILQGGSRCPPDCIVQ